MTGAPFRTPEHMAHPHGRLIATAWLPPTPSPRLTPGGSKGQELGKGCAHIREATLSQTCLATVPYVSLAQTGAAGSSMEEVTLQLSLRTRRMRRHRVKESKSAPRGATEDF